VLLYVRKSEVENIKLIMNNWNKKIKFNFNTNNNNIPFLDLEVFKGTRFKRTGIFDIRIHQKAMNKYLYIPFKSFHTKPMKQSFIYTELIRYIRNNNNIEDYVNVKWEFYKRLRDRGYPPTFLLPTFQSIYYEDRPLLLLPSSISLSTLPHHPLSAFLIKRMQREQQAAMSSSTIKLNRLVFVTFYSPLSHVLSIRNILMDKWYLIHDEFPLISKPIIAYKSHNTLGSMLKNKQTKQTTIKLDEKWSTLKGTAKSKTKTKQKSKPLTSIKHFFTSTK